MKRYVLTGTPGAGKTSIAQSLKSNGYSVIEEAATDVIARERINGVLKPEETADFIDKIIDLQRQRQIEAVTAIGDIQFYDRSPICTYALSVYLGYSPSARLLNEIDRITNNDIYQKQVFFIENLGFCEPTEARKISFEESLVFEKVHFDTYNSFGYECIKIAPDSLLERVKIIQAAL